MFIDSHAHLFDKELRPDLPAILDRAKAAGVETIVVPGTDVATSEDAVALAERYDMIFACVGYHPHEALKATDRGFESIEQLAHHEKVVAIGEIGLDYFYDFAPKDRQKEVFCRQIEMAVRMELPIVVHTRDSIQDALEIVRQSDGPAAAATSRRETRKGKGVFHCFTGSAEEAGELFSLDYYVSYPGIVTFKGSPVVETLRRIGLDRILLETDSPYLTPAPYRGKRNEPSYVPLIANKIAEVLNTTPEAVGERTSANARTLFSLPGKE